MPTARASRTIAAPLEDLWELVCDPHHLPRWWPRVTRVEDVKEDAFTQVMRTKRGKVVRADFDVRRDDAARTLTWVQRIAGTPFASLLRSAETELTLTPAAARAYTGAARAFGDDRAAGTGDGAGTQVTIELRQELGAHRSRAYGDPAGFVPRLGSPLLRRAARRTVQKALDGLEQISV